MKRRGNLRATLAGVGISFWLAMAGGVSAGPNERIVGGNVADPADWPSIAAIKSPNGSQFCGGTVIAPDAVLTAAHCAGRPSTMRVVIGRYDLSDESEGESIAVEKVFVHPEWRPRERHDVAILRLAHPTSAPPALLPTKEEDRFETRAGSELRVAGWGGTRPNGAQPSDVLLDVEVFAISNRDCKPFFPSNPRFRPAEELCAFGEEQPDGTYNDSCYGDSGGPLIADSPRGALLVGAVSYGGRLCGVNEPGVYATTADNRGFIRNRAGLARR